MDDELVTFPETRARYDLLRVALAFVGRNYEPGCDVGALHDQAARAALGFGDGALNPRTIKPKPARLLHQAFGEIFQTAVAYRNLGGPESNDNQISARAYELTPDGVDWMRDQARALEVAYDVVLYWLTSIQGGLIEATQDLSTTEEVDWHGLLR